MNNIRKHIATSLKNIPIPIWILLIELSVGVLLWFFSGFSIGHQNLNLEKIGIHPFTDEFFLGSDQLGRSVVLELLFGLQTTLSLSFWGITLAMILGVMLGLLSGYLGNTQLHIKWNTFISVVLFISLTFYLISLHHFSSSVLFNWVIPLCLATFLSMIPKVLIPARKIFYFPFDIILNRMIEIYITLPPIFIILLLTSLVRPSPALFVMYCMLSFWPEFFLLTRAETLKLKKAIYIDAARSIGQSTIRVIVYHILPNAITPILVLFSFGLARLMIIEATLSFLGIGLPPEYPGWGKMILAFHDNPSFWWLLVFPGICLILNIISIQQLGRWLEKRI